MALVWFASSYPHHHLLSAKQQPSVYSVWPQGHVGPVVAIPALRRPPWCHHNPTQHPSVALGSCSLLGFGGCIWQVEIALWCFSRNLNVFISSASAANPFSLYLSVMSEAVLWSFPYTSNSPNTKLVEPLLCLAIVLLIFFYYIIEMTLIFKNL